jgi:hypothetical protein
VETADVLVFSDKEDDGSISAGIFIVQSAADGEIGVFIDTYESGLFGRP